MGDSKEVYTPTPPPAPTLGQNINEYVAAQPKLFALQQQQAPLEAQQQVELAQRYAQPLGQAIRDAQFAINPEISNLQVSLANQAMEGSEQGLSADDINFYNERMNAQLGNQVNSGLGAQYVARNLLDLQLARQDQFRNLGLSLSGFQPIAQPQSPGFTNYSGGFTPGQAINAQTSNYASQLSYGRPMLTPNDEFSRIAGGVGGALSTMSMFSDRELKEDITDISDPVGQLKKLTGRAFSWKGTGERSAGVIAQEVEENFPEYVHEVNGKKAVDYGAIIGLLLESVKRLDSQLSQYTKQAQTV